MNINNSNGISSKDIQQYMMNESLGKGKDVKEDKSAVIPQEKVDISNKAREIQQINSVMSEIPDVRDEKVSSIKAQIENGTYNVSGEELAKKMVGEAFLDIFA